MSIRGLFLSLTFIVLGVLLVIYSKVITNWYFDKTTEPISIEPIAKATASTNSGMMKSPARKTKKKSNAEFERIKESEFTVFHGDEFRIPKGQTISFEVAEYKLLIYGPAQWNVEKWDPNLKNSPIYFTVVDGLIKMEQKGKPGLVYIVRDGRIYPPEMQPEQSEPRKIIMAAPSTAGTENKDLNVSSSENEDLNAETESLDVDEINESTPLENVEKPLKPEQMTKMPEKKLDDKILSNTEISQVLSQKTHLFRRCQINSIRENKNSEGRLLLQMTVEPSGKTNKIKILQNQTENKELGECVLAVIERVVFREFVGLPVTVSYPIEFQ